MSRVWWIAVAPLLLAAPLVAQQTSGSTREQIGRLQTRADSLARLWSEANALANLADSLAHESVPRHLDTLRVGNLLILSNRSKLPLKQAAERAWPAIDSLYGSAADTLAARPYLIHAVNPDSQFRIQGAWGLVIPWDKTVQELTDLLLIYVPIREPDRAFQQWGNGRLRPATLEFKRELEQSYVALVTSHYGVAHDCFAGSIDACRALLSLDPQADPLRIFRTPAERTEAVRSIGFGYSEVAERAIVTPCTNGDDGACVKLLGQLDVMRLPTAVGPSPRQTVLRLALSMGGRGAYTRLMADSTLSMDRRVAQAAQVPLDSVIRVWHASVVASRPRSVELPAYGPIIAMGWILAFGCVALRSSRWRVA